jgi:membrane fusion protein, heavy metal efflux system
VFSNRLSYRSGIPGDCSGNARRTALRCPILDPAVLLALLLFAACGSKPEPPPAAPPPVAAGEKVVRIDITPVRDGRIQWQAVKLAPMPQVLQVTGKIGVNENLTSRIGSLVDGRVVAVYANVGDRVAKGKVLAQIHSHEVHDARSEYAKAVAELKKREGELEFATNATNRATKLYELKATSLEQVQRAETDMHNAKFGITSAQAEINRIEEHLRHLGVSAEGAEEEYAKPSKPGEFEEDELVPVLAPIAGTVLKRFFSPGVVVSPASDLMVISDLSGLWVNAEVPERYLSTLKVGRNVNITVQAYGDTVFPGRITHIGDSLNPETRTVEVRCEARNADGRLKPEMYATISFEVGEVRDALLIPTSAVQDVEGQPTVFVRESDTQFRPRQIRIGRQAGEESQVIEGLKPGELVVANGSFLLKSELLKSQVAED